MDHLSTCPNCIAQGAESICPRCGYDKASYAANAAYLPVGRLIGRRYRVGRVLGAGGFGVTYLAVAAETGRRYAIKEYYPAQLAYREPESMRVLPSSSGHLGVFRHGLEVFANEARVLAGFTGHPFIVQVADAFEENGTAYCVMELIDGVNLNVLARSMGGRLPVSHGIEILLAMTQTLRDVHRKGLLHRDVSPENILLTRDGRAKLIDFGSTRVFVGEKSRSLSVVLKPGYAPPEQYSSKGKQGPWTDIYALCATFYVLLSGQRMPDAPDRLSGIPVAPAAQAVPSLDADVARAIDQGLLLDYRKRPESIEALCALMLSAEQKEVPGAHMVMSQRPYLQRIYRNRLGEWWEIPPDTPVIVGRSGIVSQVVVPEKGISRTHCVVQYSQEDNLFCLMDQSVNGTLLPSGARCQKGLVYTLRPGEVFFLHGMDIPILAGVGRPDSADNDIERDS